MKQTRRKKSFPLSSVYRLIEPGPVVLMTTALKGEPNIMAMSWLTMMEFEPPTIGCIISSRNYSFGVLERTKECVINIPSKEIARKVVACGNSSGRNVDKFAAFDLTSLPASVVSPPLIAECYANLECRVIDTRLIRRYGLFILEVFRAWISPGIKDPRTIHHRGQGNFMIAGKTIKLPSKAK